MSVDQVSDPMGNDTSLSATSACEDEKRAVHMRSGLALLWIQAFEEIHGKKGTSEFYHARGHGHSDIKRRMVAAGVLFLPRYRHAGGHRRTLTLL